MLGYLRDTLGIDAIQKPWDKSAVLPLYLRSGRKYSVLQIGEVECLCVELSAESFRLSAYVKQIQQLNAYWPGQIVLAFTSLTAYQRKALIEHRVSFIVAGSQMYLPWLGMVLQERKAAPTESICKLSATAQVIVFLMIEYKHIMFRQADFVGQLDVSAMTITRAVRELLAAGLVETKKEGREIYIIPKETGVALYEKALPLLQNPVRKRLWIKKDDRLIGQPLSGLSALAHYSMLSAPKEPCIAIGSRDYRILSLQEVDPNWTIAEEIIEIEVWNYDPKILGENGVVHPLPLALSLRENSDERVQQAVEEMLEEYK